MDNTKLRKIVLLALLLAALLSLFFASRHRGRPAVPPAAPAAAEGKELRIAPKPAVPKAAANRRKRALVKKPEEKRMKRISTLREPGEALLGGIGQDTAPAAAVLPAKK